MTSQEILQSDVLDILFENRNKHYGAYSLRRFYNHRMYWALAGTLSLPFVLFFFIKPHHLPAPPDAPVPDVEVQTVVLPTDIPPEAPRPPEPLPQPPAARVAQEQLTGIRITSQPEVDAPVPMQIDLAIAAIASQPGRGLPGEVPQPVPEGKGTGNAAPAEKEEPRPAEPDLAPEFPGGQAAWAHFLNRFLHPPDELQAGEKKTVLVRFLVSTDGSITGLEVVRSAGNTFDNEVLRVLKKMPKWKPARQNGRPVAVTFTQPVTFIGLEE